MLKTSMHFLAPLDLYKSEKPYSLRFDPDDPNVPKTNIKLERYDDITIEDIRGRESEFDLMRDGFSILRLDTAMTYDDFENEGKISDIYLREVADAVKVAVKADFVQIFEHTVRKRHATFPIATGGTYSYNQPTATAHIDSTADWVRELIGKMNSEEEAEKLLQRDFLCLNNAESGSVWMPLKGPVQDWPLALCHPGSVDHPKDIEPADLVYPRYNIETCQVYRNTSHKWYYITDQMPSEAWLFIQSESGTGKRVVPHSSFPLPESQDVKKPRESIETRAIAFFDRA